MHQIRQREGPASLQLCSGWPWLGGHSQACPAAPSTHLLRLALLGGQPALLSPQPIMLPPEYFVQHSHASIGASVLIGICPCSRRWLRWFGSGHCLQTAGLPLPRLIDETQDGSRAAGGLVARDGMGGVCWLMQGAKEGQRSAGRGRRAAVKPVAAFGDGAASVERNAPALAARAPLRSLGAAAAAPLVSSNFRARQTPQTACAGPPLLLPVEKASGKARTACTRNGRKGCTAAAALPSPMQSAAAASCFKLFLFRTGRGCTAYHLKNSGAELEVHNCY